MLLLKIRASRDADSAERLSRSAFLRLSSRLEITSSSFILSLSSLLFALSKIVSEIPSLFEIAKAVLVPGLIPALAVLGVGLVLIAVGFIIGAVAKKKTPKETAIPAAV